jgi:hypothetical protein
MPYSLAVVPLDRPTEVVIRPLAQHRTGRRWHLTLVGALTSASFVDTAPEPPKTIDIKRLLTGVLEVLDGRRPAGQLADVLPCQSQRELLVTALAAGPGPRTLRSVHASRTAVDVLDVCARIEHGGRSRAMVGRLVVRDGKWEFTLLSMV